jgi:hypothetical protein
MTAEPATQRYLPWPPPGLELLHGRLWPLIAVLGIGDVVLVLPLLVSMGIRQHFASMGPFGERWWIPLLTTAIGIVLLTGAAERLVRLASRAGQAAKDGHGWRTILYVASDESRDTGFLLQGARHFATLAPADRRLVLALRLAGTALALTAVILPPTGLAIGALLGRLGWLQAGALWTLAAWFPLGLIVLSALARYSAYVLARAARGDAATRAARAEAVRGEIAEWVSRSRDVLGTGGPELGSAGRRGPFRLASVGLAVVSVIVVALLALLAVAGSIVPILTSIAVPRFGSTQGRLLEAELYRAYAAPLDSSVTARAAGEALHVLTMVGQEETPAFMRAPVRRYGPFSEHDTLPGGRLMAPKRVIEGFASRGRDLSASERQLLMRRAAHPALAEFATVASAPQADVVGTRYQLPFPAGISPLALPIPRYQPLREGARARLAAALLDLAQGRADRAERGVREVISTGLALMDHGRTLIDAFIGAATVKEGAETLDGLLRATGRAREADELRRLRDQTRLVTERVAEVGMGGNVETAVRSMTRIVTDTMLFQGLRWEFYMNVRTFAPCINLHTMVFGAGQEYAAWIEEARRSLVRRESDEALFDLVSRGFFGTGGCLPLFRGIRLVRAGR